MRYPSYATLATLLLALLMPAVPALAQQAVTPAPADVPPQPEAVSPTVDAEPITRVISVRHADVHTLTELLVPLFGGRVETAASKEFGVIAVSGMPEDVQRFEEEVRKFDVRPKNIELTVYVLRGSSQGPSGPPPPEGLQPVVERLRETFPFGNYTMVDTLILRTRPGVEVYAADSVALAEGIEFGQKVQALARLAGDDPAEAIVRLEDFQYESYLETPPPAAPPVRAPVRGGPTARFTASLDVPSGESALVGKVSFSEADGALFVVVRPRVIE